MGNSSYFAGKRAGKREAKQAQELETIRALSSFMESSIAAAKEVALVQTQVVQTLVNLVDNSEDAVSAFQMTLNFLLNTSANQADAENKALDRVLDSVDKALPVLASAHAAEKAKENKRDQDLAKLQAKLEALEASMPKRRRKSS